MPSSLLIRAVLNSTMMPMWACCRSRSCGTECCTQGRGQCRPVFPPPEHPNPGSTVCQPEPASHGRLLLGRAVPTDRASSTGRPGPAHPLKLPSWQGAPCPDPTTKSSLRLSHELLCPCLKGGSVERCPFQYESVWDCSLSPRLGLQCETARLAEYLVLRPRGDAEPCSGHIRAADGLDLLHTTELGL